MRYLWLVLPVALFLFLVPVPLAGQAEKDAPIAAVDTRPADMLIELNKATYNARRAIPASENIFIEEGKVIEALYVLTRQENPVAVPIGRVAVVSKVIFLDKAIQVFFQNDKCALLILTREDQMVRDMTLEQLLDLAKKGINALFTTKSGEAKQKLPT